MNKELFNKVITKRIVRILGILKNDFNLEGSFYIGGNSLNRQKSFSDIDIFPIKGKSIDVNSGEKICATKNATTYKSNNYLLQVCNYKKESLQDLVDSFDYAHIQIGAEIQNFNIIDIYCTDNYINYNVIGDSTFVSSEYPVSSLIRSSKYFKKGQISKGQLIYSQLIALTDIIERGFIDYDDFKDQLDAVDLGLLPEELDDVGQSKLVTLFKLLEKKI